MMMIRIKERKKKNLIRVMLETIVKSLFVSKI
jgi:hypothetical protein